MGLNQPWMRELDECPADVLAGPSFEAWRVRPLGPAQFAQLRPAGLDAARLSREQLEYLCWLHVLGPTSHNTTPQRYRIGPGTIDLLLDRTLVLPESDPTGRQALLSLGTGLANIELVAQAYGWRTTVVRLSASRDEVTPDGPHPSLCEVARISFEPEAPPVEQIRWAEAVLSRKTVRAEYDEQVDLAEGVVDELLGVSRSFEGIGVHIFRDPASKLVIAKGLESAETSVLNEQSFASELGDWLVDDDADASRGMRGREFGLAPEMATRFRRGLRQELALLPDELAGFARTGRRGVLSASAAVLLTVAEDGPTQWLAAGQAYGEMSLRLWRHQYCTAMHAGLVEVDSACFAVRGRLRLAGRPVALFRVGRPLHGANWKRPHAARPHLRELLVT